MAGTKTKNKHTCADCLNHKCISTCTGHKTACDGHCTKHNKRIKCSKKICFDFILDKFVRMC